MSDKNQFLISGMDEPNKSHIALNVALQDDRRITYHRDYLSNLSAAIRCIFSYYVSRYFVILIVHQI